MLFFCAAFSQNDTVYWNGKVLDRQSSEPVSHALVHLKLSNGGMYEAVSNDSGSYFFKLKTVFEKGELSVATDKNTHMPNRRSNGFMASKDRLTFLYPEERHITYDFILERAPPCWLNRLPELWFDLNTTNMVPYKDPYLLLDSTLSPDRIIGFYYDLLSANPEIIVELKGRCDKPEKNAQALSEKRARFVADKLIAKGIPAARLLVTGAGYPAPTRVIASDPPKTEEEKKLAHQRNRSVGIRIISWDFVDPKAQKKTAAPGNSNENSEVIED